ncbi:hypothetical protein QTP88_022273 [Uroleucon formosanum]
MWNERTKNDDRKRFVYVQIVFALDKISVINDFSNSFITALSDYHQTSGLDCIQAWRRIDGTIKCLKENQRELLPEDKSDIDIELKLPEKRKKTIPKRFGENSSTNQNIGNGDTPEKVYKIKTFNVVEDNIIPCLECRFSGSKKLYYDLELFDPRRFEEIAKKWNSF